MRPWTARESGMNRFRLVIYEFLFPEIPLCEFSSVQFSSVQFSSMASLAVLTTSGASDREGTALRNWHGWTSGAGMVWLFPVPRVERARARPASDEFWRYGVLARQGPSRRRWRLEQRRQGQSRAFIECAPHPARMHYLTTRSEGHSNGWAKGLGTLPRSPNLANR